jgi:hypothetical protein
VSLLIHVDMLMYPLGDGGGFGGGETVAPQVRPGVIYKKNASTSEQKLAFVSARSTLTSLS